MFVEIPGALYTTADGKYLMDGQTFLYSNAALAYAASVGNNGSVEYLLENGADFTSMPMESQIKYAYLDPISSCHYITSEFTPEHLMTLLTMLGVVSINGKHLIQASNGELCTAFLDEMKKHRKNICNGRQ